MRRVSAWMLLAGLAFGGNTNVQADAKNYAGAACVKTSDTGTLAFQNGRVGNASTTERLRVDCPIVHDASNVLSGWAMVVDRNSSDDVECTFVDVHFYEEDPASYTVIETDATSGSSSNHVQLTYGAFPNYASASRYYSCWIPPKVGSATSYVASYQLDEN